MSKTTNTPGRRPGSVIGPQQHFLQDMEQTLWQEGENYRLTHGLPLCGPTARAPAAADPPPERATPSPDGELSKSMNNLALAGARSLATPTAEDSGATQGDLLRQQRAARAGR